MKKERLLSIDVFRGFDMMMIAGFDVLMCALDRYLNHGATSWLTAQFSHPKWFGLSFYDTIFPTFIFIAGLSFPFSFAGQTARGDSRVAICSRIIKRALILIALGLIYNRILNLNFENFRYASVLGKIGISWAIAALIYVFCGVKTRIGICFGLIAAYAVLLLTIVAPDYPTASSLSIEGNFVGWLDRMIQPGRLYQDNLCEPSGFVGCFFSSATALLGMFAGDIVRKENVAGNRKTLQLLTYAAGLLALGLITVQFIPLSKKLWSPSFMLCVGAYSTAAFAAFYWIVDVRKIQWWTTFFTVIGMNSITIYLLRKIVNFSDIAKFFVGGIAAKLTPEASAVIIAAGSFIASWLVIYFLYKKQTFLKV